MNQHHEQRQDASSRQLLDNYYRNVNPELLARIPVTSRRILEIGCGDGSLGAVFKARQPMATYCGIEVVESIAKSAAINLDDVLCADIELDPQAPKRLGASFDTLVLGDVLEHLRDPWRVLSDLRESMKPGAVCVACVPNIGHWSIIEQLLKGRWDYADSGLLDRTHLRFFTLETVLEMFQGAGWNVVDATPRKLWPEQTQQALHRLLPMAEASPEIVSVPVGETCGTVWSAQSTDQESS